MSSRFGRDTARDDLFSSYNRSASPSKSKSKARASPYNAGGYGLPADGPGFSAYPSNSTNTNGSLYGGYGAGSGYGVGAKKSDDGYGGGLNGGYRAATPNSRGQYGSATLDELESQNEEQTGVLIGKVKMLKDVCFLVEARALRGRARKPFCYLFPISSQLVAQASLTMNS
jgi:blocked-early-in-transport protein 1